MAHLISFSTSRFDASKEEPNPYNPIAGKELLNWLRGELSKTGWKVTEPDAEDWGWFVVSQKGEASYMIGASGELVDDVPPKDWMIQIEKNRSLLEKATGKNKLAADDPLSREVENIIRQAAGFTNVEVDKNA